MHTQWPEVFKMLYFTQATKYLHNLFSHFAKKWVLYTCIKQFMCSLRIVQMLVYKRATWYTIILLFTSMIYLNILE